LTKLKEKDDTPTKKKREKKTSIALFSNVKESFNSLLLEVQARLKEKLNASDFLALLMQQFTKAEGMSLDAFFDIDQSSQPEQITVQEFEQVFSTADTTSNVKKLLQEHGFTTTFINKLKSDIARPNTRRLLLCILYYIFKTQIATAKKRGRGRPKIDEEDE